MATDMAPVPAAIMEVGQHTGTVKVEEAQMMKGQKQMEYS